MQTPAEMLEIFVLLWAVIDPIGTVPVFIATTSDKTPTERRQIAMIAAAVAGGILLFFAVIGEVLLSAMGVSLVSFQIAGGVVLFLFALTMIFGEGKPQSEIRTTRSTSDTAIFPLATPSLASPGAMLAIVLLTENQSHSILNQAITTGIMLLVVACAFGLMLGAGFIQKLIGEGGASIISRVMGLILAAIATENILEGVREFVDGWQN
ncbi:MarC family protein [Calycomorphotria hydatis]|uniref:UPF0056 membrane protein n=1 Tax=Calycomorphotria hydatis TaxID=2528027 RepID=A0A517T5Z3_9PLAN|nr:MarC family protein [Calycomorphotria hydatis]QDT63802.1 hypothetical protein V22_10270 [Calycomorphotria hydatis]